MKVSRPVMREGSQTRDHTRLVAYDEAAVAVLVDAAPGCLGQVVQGQHEEGEGRE